MKKKPLRWRDKAVALKYGADKDHAPRITAKGEGHVASKIKETARRFGIPIKRDDDLIELLAQIDVDREIPPELYAAVAELLSFVYRANEALRKEIDV
jgi:flagellar biosynthesis protein